MYTLYPIYSNGFGATYLLTDNSSYDTEARRIQLVMGEIALIIDLLEIETLLKVINSSIKGCSCKNCKEDCIPKQIKCDTIFFKLVFKTDKKNIRILKDLLEKTMFEIEMNEILNFNNINYFFA